MDGGLVRVIEVVECSRSIVLSVVTAAVASRASRVREILSEDIFFGPNSGALEVSVATPLGRPPIRAC